MLIYYLAGEVILWPNAAPKPTDFYSCNGQLLPVQRFISLFARIGYTYGGSGNEFALPNIAAPIPTGGGADSLIYMICASGLRGTTPSFVNASGIVGDVRFLAGPAMSMEGALMANGAVLSVAEHQRLFSVLDKRYGGDGQTNFALPNVPPLAATNGLPVNPYILTDGYYPVRENEFSKPLGERLVSEIRLSTTLYAQAGFLPTRGTPLLVSRYRLLFLLVGKSFGGDGRTTFSLPDLGPVAGVAYSIADAGIYPS